MPDQIQILVSAPNLDRVARDVGALDQSIAHVGTTAAGVAPKLDGLDKAALQGAKSTQAFTGALGAVSPQLGAVGTAVDSLAGSLGRVDAARAAAGVGLVALGAGLVGALGQLGGAASDFEHRMAQVRAVMSQAEWAEHGTEIRQLALDLGKSGLGFSAGEAAKGLEEMAKAGISVQQMATAAPAVLQLAAAGGISVGEAAEFAANTLSVFKLQGEDMARVANTMAGAANATTADIGDLRLSMQQFGAVAALTGQSMESTTLAIAAMAQAGIKGSDAGTSLKVMFSNLQPTTKDAITEMERLGLFTIDYTRAADLLTAQLGQYGAAQKLVAKHQADGTATAANLFKVLQQFDPELKKIDFERWAQDVGLTTNAFIDASGAYKQAADIAGVLNQATQGLTESQKQMSLRVIFGMDAIRAAAILADQGAEGFSTLAAAIDKVSAAEVATTRLDSLQGSLKNLEATVNAVAIEFGEHLAPGADTAIQSLTGLIGTLSRLPEPAQASVVQVGLLTGGLLAVTGGVVALGAVLPALTAGLAAFGLTIGAVAVPIGAVVLASAALVVAWNHDWGNIRAITTGAAQAVGSTLGQIRDDLSLLSAFVTTVWGPQLVESLSRPFLVVNFWKDVLGQGAAALGIKEGLEQVLGTIGPYVDDAAKRLALGVFPPALLGRAAFDAMRGAANEIRAAHPELTAAGQEAGAAVTEGIVEGVAESVTAVQPDLSHLSDLLNGLTVEMPDLAQAGDRAGDVLEDAFARASVQAERLAQATQAATQAASGVGGAAFNRNNLLTSDRQTLTPGPVGTGGSPLQTYYDTGGTQQPMGISVGSLQGGRTGMLGGGSGEIIVIGGGTPYVNTGRPTSELFPGPWPVMTRDELIAINSQTGFNNTGYTGTPRWAPGTYQWWGQPGEAGFDPIGQLEAGLLGEGKAGELGTSVGEELGTRMVGKLQEVVVEFTAGSGGATIRQALRGLATTDEMAAKMRADFQQLAQEAEQDWQIRIGHAKQLQQVTLSTLQALNTYSGQYQGTTSSFLTGLGGPLGVTPNINLGGATPRAILDYGDVLSNPDVQAINAQLEQMAAALQASGWNANDAATWDQGRELQAQYNALLEERNRVMAEVLAGLRNPYEGGPVDSTRPTLTDRFNGGGLSLFGLDIIDTPERRREREYQQALLERQRLASGGGSGGRGLANFDYEGFSGRLPPTGPLEGYPTDFGTRQVNITVQTPAYQPVFGANTETEKQAAARELMDYLEPLLRQRGYLPS